MRKIRILLCSAYGIFNFIPTSVADPFVVKNEQGKFEINIEQKLHDPYPILDVTEVSDIFKSEEEGDVNTKRKEFNKYIHDTVFGYDLLSVFGDASDAESNFPIPLNAEYDKTDDTAEAEKCRDLIFETMKHFYEVPISFSVSELERQAEIRKRIIAYLKMLVNVRCNHNPTEKVRFFDKEYNEAPDEIDIGKTVENMLKIASDVICDGGEQYQYKESDFTEDGYCVGYGIQMVLKSLFAIIQENYQKCLHEMNTPQNSLVKEQSVPTVGDENESGDSFLNFTHLSKWLQLFDNSKQNFAFDKNSRKNFAKYMLESDVVYETGKCNPIGLELFRASLICLLNEVGYESSKNGIKQKFLIKEEDKGKINEIKNSISQVSKVSESINSMESVKRIFNRIIEISGDSEDKDDFVKKNESNEIIKKFLSSETKTYLTSLVKLDKKLSVSSFSSKDYKEIVDSFKEQIKADVSYIKTFLDDKANGGNTEADKNFEEVLDDLKTEENKSKFFDYFKNFEDNVNNKEISNVMIDHLNKRIEKKRNNQRDIYRKLIAKLNQTKLCDDGEEGGNEKTLLDAMSDKYLRIVRNIERYLTDLGFIDTSYRKDDGGINNSIAVYSSTEEFTNSKFSASGDTAGGLDSYSQMPDNSTLHTADKNNGLVNYEKNKVKVFENLKKQINEGICPEKVNKVMQPGIFRKASVLFLNLVEKNSLLNSKNMPPKETKFMSYDGSFLVYDGMNSIGDSLYSETNDVKKDYKLLSDKLALMPEKHKKELQPILEVLNRKINNIREDTTNLLEISNFMRIVVTASQKQHVETFDKIQKMYQELFKLDKNEAKKLAADFMLSSSNEEYKALENNMEYLGDLKTQRFALYEKKEEIKEQEDQKKIGDIIKQQKTYEEKFTELNKKILELSTKKGEIDKIENQDEKRKAYQNLEEEFKKINDEYAELKAENQKLHEAYENLGNAIKVGSAAVPPPPPPPPPPVFKASVIKPGLESKAVQINPPKVTKPPLSMQDELEKIRKNLAKPGSRDKNEGGSKNKKDVNNQDGVFEHEVPIEVNGIKKVSLTLPSDKKDELKKQLTTSTTDTLWQLYSESYRQVMDAYKKVYEPLNDRENKYFKSKINVDQFLGLNAMYCSFHIVRFMDEYKLWTIDLQKVETEMNNIIDGKIPGTDEDIGEELEQNMKDITGGKTATVADRIKMFNLGNNKKIEKKDKSKKIDKTKEIKKEQENKTLSEDEKKIRLLAREILKCNKNNQKHSLELLTALTNVKNDIIYTKNEENKISEKDHGLYLKYMKAIDSMKGLCAKEIKEDFLGIKPKTQAEMLEDVRKELAKKRKAIHMHDDEESGDEDDDDWD